MAKASAASRALARVKNLKLDNEALKAKGRAALAAVRSETGQTVAIAAVAGAGGAYAGYKMEEWLHDPERGYAADSVLVKGISGIPVTTVGGAALAGLGIFRIMRRKGSLKTNAALASLGAGLAGGGYIHKVSTEV